MSLIPFHIKIYNHLLSHLTIRTSTESNLYSSITFATVMLEPAVCRLLTFYIPTSISIFLHIGHLSKESKSEVFCDIQSVNNI
jgi:hypothetical protein